MSGRVIRAIVAKDLREFSRNRVWFLAMAIALGVMTVVFWLLPVEHPRFRLRVGLCPQELADTANATLMLARLGRLGEQGAALAKAVRFVPLADEDRVRAAVSRGRGDGWHEVSAAVVFPDDFIAAVGDGRTPTVSLYLDDGLPDEIKEALAVCIREVAHALGASAAGRPLARSLPISLPDLDTTTLGIDLQGGHVPPGTAVRAVMLGSMAIFSAVVLAWLISDEFERRTIAAMLITPASVGEVIAGKAVTGVIICMGQALVYVLATLRFEENWPPLLLFLFLSAVMMSAIGMIAGTIGKGFADTLIWSLLLTVPLGLPLLSFAGGHSLFDKLLPSYWVIMGMNGMAFYGWGWSRLMPYVYMAMAWDAALLCLGWVALKKKLEAQ